MVALSAPNEAAARPLTSSDASGPSSGGPELDPARGDGDGAPDRRDERAATVARQPEIERAVVGAEPRHRHLALVEPGGRHAGGVSIARTAHIVASSLDISVPRDPRSCHITLGPAGTRLASRVAAATLLVDAGRSGAEIARRRARPALERTGEVRWIGVSERTGDFTDSRSPVLQHLLGGCAPGPLDDPRVAQACGAEPSLEGPDTRRHPLGDEIDTRGASAASEPRADGLLDALRDVASGRGAL